MSIKDHIDKQKMHVDLMVKGFTYDESLEAIEKSWSTNLMKKFPNGQWKTINGAKVFVDGGKVVAGLDGFNGKIDNFFKEGSDNGKNKSNTIVVGKGLSKDWKSAINKWVDKVPEEAHPTTISNFSEFKKMSGRDFREVRDITKKYGVSISTQEIKLPKDQIPKDILTKMRKDGRVNERVFEIAKYYNVDSSYFDQNVQIVGVNSRNYKDKKEFKERKESINKRYNEKYGKDYFLNTTLEGTFVHELGHVYNNRMNVVDSQEWNDVWWKWSKEKHTPDLVVKSKSEAFSEAFSNYYVEKGKGLPKYVNDYLKEQTAKKGVKIPDHIKELLQKR